MSEKILSDAFVNKYKNKNPDWGFNGLGYIVYKRTYSRIKGDGTKEEWFETVERCINGAQDIGAKYTKEEAERLYDLVFNLKCNFAGRMLWQLGAPTVARYGGASLLNCWFVSMNDIEDFCFVFENLMLGGGVGFSVQRADIHELPKVKAGVSVIHQSTKDTDFIVPDSREGWVSLLRKVVDSFFVSGKSFTYSTILVRGSGEKISGFGGTASGPTILVTGIEQIISVLQGREGKKLRSIDVLDINNIIGSVVVAGNVRRCLPDNYLVYTERGSVALSDIKVGDNVKTAYGYKKVNAVFDQGTQNVSTIKTIDGETFSATKNHRLLIYNKVNGMEWKSVDEINKETDFLVKPKNLVIETKSKYTYEIKKEKNLEDFNLEDYDLIPIVEIEYDTHTTKTIDIEVDEKNYFYVANPENNTFIVSHNSAQIAIGDPDDHLYIRAKNWADGNIPNWRNKSNNSIYADSFNQISRDIWETGYQKDAETGMAKGEPYGFINIPLAQKFGRLIDGPMKDNKMYPTNKDNCEGVNPCLTGDTLIHTSRGNKKLEDVIKDVKNGDIVWASSLDIKTGILENSPIETGDLTRKQADIIELELEDGTTIKMTPNHLVYTENRGYVKASILTPDDVLLKII